MEHPLARKTAGLLRGRLDSMADPLPSLAVLAGQFRVSRQTMWHAVQMLRQEGAVEVSRGSRIRLCVGPARPPLRQMSIPSHERVLATYTRQIGDGILRAGTSLPKVSFAAQTHGVSQSTIVRVHKELVARGQVTRKGKRLIVGGPAAGIGQLHHPRVIVVLLNHRDDWHSLAVSNRTTRFCQAFSTECEQFGVSQLSVVCEPQPSFRRLPVCGRGPALEAIRDLGDRYLGTVVATSARQTHDIAVSFRELLRFQRPVVWFDRYGERNVELPRSALFTRCYFDEFGTARACCDFLISMGHRTAGAMRRRTMGWTRSRTELLERAAAQCTERLLILPSPMEDEALSVDNDPTVVADEFRRLHLSGRRRIRAHLDILFRNVKSREKCGTDRATYKRMAELFRDDALRRVPYWSLMYLLAVEPIMEWFLKRKEISVIIAPNDATALSCYDYLSLAGIQVPRELSLISFDNYPTLQGLPITSVDFGFGSLGYAAFHAIAGDIKLSRDASGHIPARAKVVRRGSVGVPVSAA